MTAAIRISGLIKDFRTGIRGRKLRAVDNIDLEVPAGAVYGLLGPNGSGKSTTLKVLLGIQQPTRGSCEIFGLPGHSIDARRRLGYLPEAPYFYKFLSGRELIRFSGRMHGMDADALAEQTEAVLRLVDLMPAAGRAIGTYSKGMLQRIGLAQALVNDPELVILDEPTAGVDPVGAAAITELIGELKARGKTILLCSHLLTQVEDVCDRVAIMNRGSVVAEGTVNELLEDATQQHIKLEAIDAQTLVELQQWLDGRGVRLAESRPARISLQDFFLNLVKDNSQ